MKIILTLFLLLAGSSSFAADEWSRGYVYNQASASGSDIWFGPGDRIEAGSAARARTVWSQGTGGINAVESGAVALRDGRSVTLTATRKITTSAVFGGLASFASSPVGLAAALAIPFVIDWIAGDNEEHIRINPSGTGVEIRETGDACYVAPCYLYRYSSLQTWQTSMSTACAGLPAAYNGIGSSSVTYKNPTLVGTGCRVENWEYGSLQYTDTKAVQLSPTDPENPPGWLPSSMDDIAPYMTPRVPPAALVPYLLEKGITFPAENVSVTGPSPELAPLPVSKKTTIYAEPPPVVSPPVILDGNPYGLPANTPTTTSSSTGSQSLSPTSSSKTGPNPPSKDHGPVTTPTQTVTKSTYNPTTDKTTSTTTKTQDGAKQETTSTTTTTITNTPNTSTVTNVITNITNITNTTTNELMSPPLEETQEGTEPSNKDDIAECERNPETIGCAQFGEPTPPDELVKETIDVSITPVSFAGSGACPAPLSFNVSGHSYAVSYDSLCEKLAILKYLFLAMAGFIAAWVVASLFKV